MQENTLARTDLLLRKAARALDREDVESATSYIVEARSTMMKSVSLSSVGEEGCSVLLRTIHLAKCIMFYYKALSERERKLGNETLRLAYLGHALGVNTMIGTSLIPLMQSHGVVTQSREEISLLSKQNRAFGDGLCKSIALLVKRIQGHLKGESKEKLSTSITKIINAVDRNAESIRSLAVELGKRFEAGDFKQARRIYEFVRDEIQYIHDPLGFEQIQSPDSTLKLRAGDCEDQAILLCSLLSVIGFQTALVFSDADNDGIADHVYSAVYIQNAPDYCKPLAHKMLESGKDLNDWIPLDPTSLDSDFGVIPIGDFQIAKFAAISSE